MTATVIYGFHLTDLHDWLTAGAIDDVIDLSASTSNYITAVEKALAEAFPEAEIEVRYDLHRTGSLPSNLQPRYLDADGGEDDERVMDILAVVASVDADIESWIVLSK